MKTIIIYIITFGILTMAKADTNIINVTFNTDTLRKYTKNMVNRDFPMLNWQSLFERASIVKDEKEERGNVLRVEYPRIIELLPP